ncbi:MAG TPA: glycosyltransferase family 4 protein [Candidatus Acidoferrum sp.]|nr:glycosyltransferase family 4 protein [Candidatus Acidoferrum sp.]
MSDRRYRVLALAAHPVPYSAPLFRRMAAHPRFDLQVAYCTLQGAEAAHDPEFGTSVQWDVPLLDGHSWCHLPNRGSGRDSFFGLRNPRVAPLIREGRFDAVLCYVGYRCATFWIAFRAARAANSAFLFGTDAVTLSPRVGWAWKAAFKKRFWPYLFRLADQVIVPSSGARDLMLSLGLPLERVTLTPYAVDNDWWMRKSAAVNRSAVRSSWGIRETDSVILFCGKLQPWKRPGDLLAAFALAQTPGAHLFLAGEGPLREQLEAQAARLGVREQVRFLGFVNQSQLPALYTAADLMVMPSGYEAFAVVVNEAMCCGCPVAASNHVGAARDLVAPVRREFVYPCGDVSALASLLKDALADPQTLAALGRRAVAHVQTWSPESNIEATLEAVAAAVSRKTPRPLDAIPHSPSTGPSSAAPQESRE